MSVASEIAAYKLDVIDAITSKTAINSITPENVGDADTDLADLILPWLQIVEAGGGEITGGTSVPDDGVGVNGDVYYRITGGQFYVYRKESGSWVAKVNLTLGFTLPDGPLNIRASILDFDVTVTPGSWVISNVIYNKATTTGITVNAADINFSRYDLIYANTSGTVGYLAGTAASTPAFPTTPANSIVVDYVIVPSSSSGDDPYMFYAGAGSAAANSNAILVSGTSDSNGEFDASGYGIGEFPNVTIYDVNGDTSPATYNNTLQLIKFLNPSEAFKAQFR